MSDNRKENSYRTILKRISAFGGVQLFSILANLVRGKFAALLLGPAGMGISSLFNTAATSIQQLAGLGLNLSLVKEVASSREEPGRHATVLSVAARLILFTSLLGAIVCVALSPFLSEWTFGSRDYTLSFIMLSAGVALSIAGLGYLALLQGLSEVKRLSLASLVGSLTGVLAGVPLYYFFGTRGIVPAIILIYLSTFIFYYVSYRKAVKYDDVRFSWRSHSPLVKRLISLGLIFMLGTLAGSLTSYLINMFIRSVGSLEEVGLFQAAGSLTSQYMAVLFTAIAMDYFPRLSAASADLAKMRHIANRQAEVIVLLAAPLVLALIAMTSIVIHILLSSEFLPIVPLVRWLAAGIIVQVMTFPLGYYFLAKENKRVYFWLEIVFSNLSWIACCAILYPLMGLIGLGIGNMIHCVIDFFLAYIICRRIYGFRYSQRTFLIICACIVVTAAGFIFSLYDTHSWCAVAMWATFAAAAIFALLMLRRRISSEKAEAADTEADDAESRNSDEN